MIFKYLGDRFNSYHDYVFKDGTLVGKFEEMYADCVDQIPWHQNETRFCVYAESIFKFLSKYYEPKYSTVESNYALFENSKKHGYEKETYVRFLGTKRT